MHSERVSTKFVRTLDDHTIRCIRELLIAKFGVLSYVEDALDGRISDLSDMLPREFLISISRRVDKRGAN